MTEDMFTLAKERYVGCQEEAIDEPFICNSMEPFKFTPFKASEDHPVIELDSILE